MDFLPARGLVWDMDFLPARGLVWDMDFLPERVSMGYGFPS